MATIEKKISVDGSFKLKIGETEISLSREEAEALYGELYKNLCRPGYPYWIINPVPQYPGPWDGYIKIGDFPPYGNGTWCTVTIN